MCVCSNTKSRGLLKLPTTRDARLDTSSLTTIHMSFILSNLTYCTLPTDKCLTILFSLLNTWVAINLGFMCNKTTILHYCSSNCTFTFDFIIESRILRRDGVHLFLCLLLGHTFGFNLLIEAVVIIVVTKALLAVFI